MEFLAPSPIYTLSAKLALPASLAILTLTQQTEEAFPTS
jgi:hypothetical protein